VAEVVDGHDRPLRSTVALRTRDNDQWLTSPGPRQSQEWPD
jgi:hypothetical protein